MTNKFTSDVVVGLEIHIELATDSKLFCGCATHGTEEPNSRICPVCLGHPGSKPVLNKKAVEYSIKLALALNCKIASNLIFSRKSYFYPDMAKNYQISQYELPLGLKGCVELGSGKKVGITRVHMEEDPAALVHPSGMQNSPFVLVDYNRSGDPLCEVVTEPDMTSPEDARDFMKHLITILEYLGIFDVNRCIIKADANVSIKESGYVRSEIKNVTGFKDIERALRYEVARQKENPSEVVLETRGWDAEKGVTFSLRKKEVEAEYGYIIDPDLVKIEMSDSFVDSIKKGMPELASDKLKKYEDKHGKVQSISVIIKDPKLASFFESVVKDPSVDEKTAAHWIENIIKRILNDHKCSIDDTKIKPANLIDVIKLVKDKKITEKVGKDILITAYDHSLDVDKYVEEKELVLIEDSSEIEAACKKVVAEQAPAVEKYKNGDEKVFNFIVGQVMRATQGKADHSIVVENLKKLI
jgi:aspartyl-tRNA(Asn)/glutamyl-tRNA(Gln) amidotransferase subunit B